jgi:hypothetical protein
MEPRVARPPSIYSLGLSACPNVSQRTVFGNWGILSLCDLRLTIDEPFGISTRLRNFPIVGDEVTSPSAIFEWTANERILVGDRSSTIPSPRKRGERDKGRGVLISTCPRLDERKSTGGLLTSSPTMTRARRKMRRTFNPPSADR